MRTLIEYLIGLGHKNFLFLGGLLNSRSYEDKAEQFSVMMRRYGIPEEKSMRSIHAAMKQNAPVRRCAASPKREEEPPRRR